MRNVTIKNVLLSLTTVLAVACGTSHKTTAGYEKTPDFATEKTFRVDIKSVPGSITSKNAALLVNSAKNKMAKKGFTKKKTSPGQELKIITRLKEGSEPRVNTNQVGGFGSIQEQIYWSQYKTTPKATKSTSFSLTIVIADAATSKNVWQGTAIVELAGASVNPERVIDSTVTNILAGFSTAVAKR